MYIGWEDFFSLSRIALDELTDTETEKTNPRVSMNDKRLSDDDDDFRRRPSLGVAKLTSPPLFPFRWASRRWEGWRAFSPSVPTPRPDTSLRPFSSTASSAVSSLPDSSLRDAPFYGSKARTTLFSASSRKSSATAPGAFTRGWDLYVMSHVARSYTRGDVISKQLVVKSIQNSLLSPGYITEDMKCKLNFKYLNCKFV